MHSVSGEDDFRGDAGFTSHFVAAHRHDHRLAGALEQQSSGAGWLAGGEPGAVGENWLLPGGDERRADHVAVEIDLEVRAAAHLREQVHHVVGEEAAGRAGQRASGMRSAGGTLVAIGGV